MAGSVIVRTLGETHHENTDTAISWEEADARAGFRLDRRKSWAFIPSDDVPELCEMAVYSQQCTGCTEYPENTSPPEKGIGCSECGYTGRSRNYVFQPFFKGIDDE